MIRPLMSKEKALELGFSENEVVGPNAIVVTDPKDFTELELDSFRNMPPGMVPDSVKLILTGTGKL